MSKVDQRIVQNNLELLVKISEKPSKVVMYTFLAIRLSKIADKNSPWTWRYVQSVHHGTIAPSKKFARAVEKFIERGLRDPKPSDPEWLKPIKRGIRKMVKETNRAVKRIAANNVMLEK